MANFDQAEGLRRMLFGAKPRFVTFLSSLRNEEKNATLVNLAAGLAQLGNDVVVLDAQSNTTVGMSVAMWLETPMAFTLLDVVKQKCTIHQATKSTSYGFKLMSALRCQHATNQVQPTGVQTASMSRLVEKVGNSLDMVLVDGELNDAHRLFTDVLEEGEIVILVTNHPDSIKTAYSLIKRAHRQFGRRSYGILVTGVNDCEAQRVYDAMAQAAGNFLSVPLSYLGFVPEDDCLRRASRSGRSVIDVFPAAHASKAFSRLAQQMIATNEFVHS